MDANTLTLLPPGWSADPERAALHEAATLLMNQTGFDYVTAVQHAELAQRQARHHPPVTAARAAPAGRTTTANLATESRPAGYYAPVCINGGTVELIP